MRRRGRPLVPSVLLRRRQPAALAPSAFATAAIAAALATATLATAATAATTHYGTYGSCF